MSKELKLIKPFLQDCFTFDLSVRPSASNLLKHSYFSHNICEGEYRNFIQGIRLALQSKKLADDQKTAIVENIK